MQWVRARHIQVSDQQFCFDLKKQLEAGKDFAVIARQFSECTTARHGGDLGRFAAGQMGDAIDQIAFQGELGWVYGPVQSDRGFHLVQVTNREEHPKPPESS